MEFSRGSGPARAAKVRKGSETHLKVEVPDRFLSTSHASLEKILGGWLLVDKGSRNGTFVDGVAVERSAVEDGTAFEIGHSFFVFRRFVGRRAGRAAARPGWRPLR